MDRTTEATHSPTALFRHKFINKAWLLICILALSGIRAVCLPPPPDPSNPSIETIPDQAMLSGSRKLIHIIVGSELQYSSNWTVSANSANTSVLPNEALNLFVNGSGTNRTINIKGLPGITGTTLISVRARDERGAEALTTFNLTIRATNSPPKVFPIADAEVEAGGQVTIPFQVEDDESNPDDLILSASADTASVITPSDVVFTRSGTKYFATLKATPGGQAIVVVTITATDSDGGKSSSSFNVFVTRVNTPPEISQVQDQLIEPGAKPLELKFNIFDNETPLSRLTVSATSSKPTILSESNFKFSGDGFERTLLITPTPGIGGVVEITLTVRDGISAAASSKFLLVNQGVDLESALVAGQLVLKWPNLEKFNLRFVADVTSSPTAPLNWQVVQQQPVAKGAGYELTLPIASNLGQQLFRLRRVF